MPYRIEHTPDPEPEKPQNPAFVTLAVAKIFFRPLLYAVAVYYHADAVSEVRVSHGLKKILRYSVHKITYCALIAMGNSELPRVWLDDRLIITTSETTTPLLEHFHASPKCFLPGNCMFDPEGKHCSKKT